LKRLLLAAGIIGIAACSDATSPPQVASRVLRPTATFLAGNNTVIVSPANTDGWFFYNDETDAIDASLGSFVAGPALPTYGVGSAQISVTGTQRRNLATYQFAGIALSDITVMKFRLYNPSAGNGGSASRSAYLNFNVDFNGSDTWQRRLVFLPSDNGTVTQDSWKEWDAINSGAAAWRYSGNTWPITGESGNTTKTWNQIKADYPGVRIRATDAFLGVRVGEPYADGYTENIDSFTFGTAAGTTIYDFEPTAAFGSCNVSVVGSKITLLDNCVTDHTLYIPDGFTLDGAGKTITGVDPVGGHFLGAVVRNGGSNATVTNLGVTVSNLADVCDAGDDRLRGIMLAGASGTISNNVVTNIRQVGSGCQEGNAIEARNAPFTSGGADLNVTIKGNTISSYQKTGIVANGSVSANITGNSVTGLGPIAYIAQNGIQVGFGGTAVAKNNVVTGNNYTPTDTEACGILLYEADGVKLDTDKVLNKLVTANEVQVCDAGRGGKKYNPQR
jgi:hypothetical protein